MKRRTRSVMFTAAVLGLAPVPAMAYVGPGSGLSAVGAFLALLAGVVVALFGFVWYPVKRLLRKRRRGSGETAGGDG